MICPGLEYLRQGIVEVVVVVVAVVLTLTRRHSSAVRGHRGAANR